MARTQRTPTPRHKRRKKRAYLVSFAQPDRSDALHDVVIEAEDAETALNQALERTGQGVILGVRELGAARRGARYPDARFIRGAFRPSALMGT